MSLQTYFTRLGAAKVKLPTRLSTTIPDLTTLSYLASAATVSNYVATKIIGPQAALDPTAQYWVCLVLLGEDRTNGGLTWTQASPVKGPITVNSSYPAITINALATGFPANMTNAYAMGVMLSKNSNNNFGLVQYDIIDRVGNNFDTIVVSEPQVSQTFYPIAALQTNVADYTNYPELGVRTAYGCSFGAPVRTTGGVGVQRIVDNVNVNPDGSTAYPQYVTGGTTITFSVLANDMFQTIQGNAGKYGKFISPQGHTLEIGKMSLQTASSFLGGNIPVQLVIPVDGNRVPEIRYYLASVEINPVGSSEGWRKDSVNPVNFTVVTANTDPLLNDVEVELQYKYKA